MANGSRQDTTISIGWLYVISGLVMVALVIAAIVAITFARPTADNGALMLMIVGFGTSTYASIVAALKAQEAKHSAKETGHRVDGRINDLLKETEARSKTEGRAEGVGLGAAAVAAAIPVAPVVEQPPKEATP